MHIVASSSTLSDKSRRTESTTGVGWRYIIGFLPFYDICVRGLPQSWLWIGILSLGGTKWWLERSERLHGEEEKCAKSILGQILRKSRRSHLQKLFPFV